MGNTPPRAALILIFKERLHRSVVAVPLANAVGWSPGGCIFPDNIVIATAEGAHKIILHAPATLTVNREIVLLTYPDLQISIRRDCIEQFVLQEV